jgi:hypothetical protein
MVSRGCPIISAMNRGTLIFCAALAICISASAQSPSTGGSPTPGPVPVMDGGAGPCSLDLTVIGTDGKPVYDATVKVHIAYGFAGARKLDLQAGTNADGKLRFTGLPARVHRPPLKFVASKGELQAKVMYDAEDECQAKHEVALQGSRPEPSQ